MQLLSDKKQLQFQSALKLTRHKNRFYLSTSGDHILFAFYSSVIWHAGSRRRANAATATLIGRFKCTLRVRCFACIIIIIRLAFRLFSLISQQHVIISVKFSEDVTIAPSWKQCAPSCLVFSSQWASISSLLCTHLITKLCEPARLEYEISRPIMRSYAHSPIYARIFWYHYPLLLFILILSVSGICKFI